MCGFSLNISPRFAQDVYGAVERIKAEGGKVTREAGPVKGGSTVIAFVKDPSGYLWELLQRGDTPEPLCQVINHESKQRKTPACMLVCMHSNILQCMHRNVILKVII